MKSSSSANDFRGSAGNQRLTSHWSPNRQKGPLHLWQRKWTRTSSRQNRFLRECFFVMDHVDEEDLHPQHSKVYQCCARRVDVVKTLKDNTRGKVRFEMRPDDAMKIVSNFYSVDDAPHCVLRRKAGSATVWTCLASDFSSGELMNDNFSLTFVCREEAVHFKDALDEARMKTSIYLQEKRITILFCRFFTLSHG